MWFRINPTALCFLTCAIPCVWLLELRLFNERTSGKLFPWIELLPPSTNTTLQDVSVLSSCIANINFIAKSYPILILI